MYLTHYEVIKSEERRLALFLKTRRVAAILDKSQKIKDPESGTARALHRLREGFVRQIIMTGTPVANRPFDLWSQVFFLDGGEALGTDFAKFQSSLDLSNDLWSDHHKRSHFEDALAEVFAKICDFTVRETKESSGIQLPEKRIENITVEAEHRQRGAMISSDLRSARKFFGTGSWSRMTLKASSSAYCASFRSPRIRS